MPSKSKKSNARSVNLVPSKKKKKGNKLTVAKSYKQAYNYMQPSKEIKKITDDYTLVTNGTMAQGTEHEVLDVIAQGTQLNQRLGASIYLSYLHLDLTLQSNSTTKAKAVRMMVFREINNGGVDTSTFADLFRGPGTAVYAPNHTQRDLQFPLNKDLVQPIYDKKIVVKPEYEGITVIKRKIKLGKYARYPSLDSSTVGVVHGRLIFLLLLADCDNTPSATQCVLAGGLRIFFKDSNSKK